jgi:hypothetical protein
MLVLQDFMSRARKSASLAFRGQDVKLHNEFQVGKNGGHSLADTLYHASIITASCRVVAMEILDTTDDSQEESKDDGVEATGFVVTDANTFYEGLLAIQNASNNEYPESNPANAPARMAFRLGVFPPRHKPSVPPAEPTPPAPVP